MSDDFLKFEDESAEVEKDVIGSSTFISEAKNIGEASSAARWLIKRITTQGGTTVMERVSQKYDQVKDDKESIFGTPLFKNARSLLLRGGNQNVNVGDVTDLKFDGTTPFTLSCWGRNTTTAEQCLIAKQGGANNAGYRMTFHAGNLRWHLANSSGSRIEMRAVPPAVSDDNWHHAIVSYDGSQDESGVLMYFDGLDVTPGSAQVNTLNASTDTTLPFAIGIRNNTAQDFIGFIDEPAVWNVALTPAQMVAVYNAGSPSDLINDPTLSPIAANLMGWWRVDNDVHPDVLDVSGRGNHGTFLNGQPSNFVGEVP